MSDLSKHTLQLLLAEYQRTLKAEVHCEIPFSQRDSKQEIAQELFDNGYITKYDFYGRVTLRCTLSQKAIQQKED